MKKSYHSDTELAQLFGKPNSIRHWLFKRQKADWSLTLMSSCWLVWGKMKMAIGWIDSERHSQTISSSRLMRPPSAGRILIAYILRWRETGVKVSFNVHIIIGGQLHERDTDGKFTTCGGIYPKQVKQASWNGISIEDAVLARRGPQPGRRGIYWLCPVWQRRSVRSSHTHPPFWFESRWRDGDARDRSLIGRDVPLHRHLLVNFAGQ